MSRYKAEAEKFERWYEIARKDADEWQAKYEAEHQRIIALANEHMPKLNPWNEDELPGVNKPGQVFAREEPRFSCVKCPHYWPCPTYLWATGSEKFRLRIEPIEKKSEEQP